jgi:hypothetical protein
MENAMSKKSLADAIAALAAAATALCAVLAEEEDGEIIESAPKKNGKSHDDDDDYAEVLVSLAEEAGEAGFTRADALGLGLTAGEWNKAITSAMEAGLLIRQGEKRGTRYHSADTAPRAKKARKAKKKRGDSDDLLSLLG